MTLSYNGSGFHGWQVQPGLVTVQGTLAEALHRITGASVLPQGAGRTDAGVHALAQVASFTLPVALPPASLQRALNRVLPVGLRVLEAKIVAPSFHARHSARRKHYEYRIFERRMAGIGGERICSPFLAPFVWDCRWPLALEGMQAGAALLLGTQDFSAMAASRRDLGRRSLEPFESGPMAAQPNPVKTIHSATWKRQEGLLLFSICGSGFLHHMVRNLVGTLVDIGRGSLQPDDLTTILASKDRAQAGPTAPASGLFLRAVEFDPAFDVAPGMVADAKAPTPAGAAL